ncbi:MAG: pyridoxamine 5'-phosphate oxidase family protein, partial [Pseudomonadota bacterium]
DSLRNIVEDGRLSLMFMVPGSNNVVRVNGTAFLTTDESATLTFNQRGKNPRTVIVMHVGEVYYQCAKALMRSRLWQAEDESAQVPTAGQFIKEREAEFDAESYDAGYAEYAKDKMW